MELPVGRIAPVECRARVEGSQFIAKSVRETVLRLLSPVSWTFDAGQFAAFDLATSKGPAVRCYSLASEPSALPEIRFTVKLVRDAVGPEFFERLRPGEEVRFRGPYGRFTPCELAGAPRLFVAAGTGIAPLRSMVRELLALGVRDPLTLLFGLRDEEGAFYLSEFDELARRQSSFRFVPTLSQPKAAWSGVRGRVTRLLETGFPVLKNHDAYVCGPGEMVREVTSLLAARGLDPAHLHREAF